MSYVGISQTSHARPEAAGTSPLLLGLLTTLNDKGVSYCFWKSGRRIAKALSGDSDLDLLVGRGDRDNAVRLLIEQGFRHWPDVAWRSHPSIMSFLGYDEVKGTIQHVHIHFRLVIGHALLKNYRIPCEDRFLARSIMHPQWPVRLLHPADEALLLIVRAQLEFSLLDPIAWRQKGAIERKFADDIAALAPIISQDVLAERAGELFGQDLAGAMAKSFSENAKLWWRHPLRAAIVRALVPYQLYGNGEANLRALARAAMFVGGKLNRRFLHLARPTHRLAPGGGIVVSFVGLDGSGKSTQVAMAHAWLEQETDVFTSYFGTGDGRAALVLLPFKALVPLVTAFIKTKPKGASHGRISDRPPGWLYSILFAIWSGAVALEKLHKIRSARRAANRGLIVLTDRYPQNEITGFNDGPLLPRLPHAPAWLRRFEASAYMRAHRTPPDLVIKLITTAEIVEKREPDMSPLLVRQRIGWLEELKFPGARVVSIDAKKPLDEVARMVRREIWKAL